MELEFVKDYKESENLRHSFNELAGLVFGIDFEKWYQLGFWNDRYICYSYVDNGKVVANVSANIIDLQIGGQMVPAIQIGTVMTHPDYRWRGLARKLMNMAMDDHADKCDVFFLFANPEAQGFYERLGFDRVNETCFYADSAEIKGNSLELKAIAPKKRSISPDCGDIVSVSKFSAVESGELVRKLSMSDANDVDILRRLSLNRIPFSNRFDTMHTEGILYWHCLNSFPEDIHYIASLDTIVIYRMNGGILDVYDIICTSEPNYRQILRALNADGAEEILFHFTLETKDSAVLCRPHLTEEYIFYAKSKVPRLTGDFFYPETAHA